MMFEITQSLEAIAWPTATFLINYWIHSSIFMLMVLIGIKFAWIKTDGRGEQLLKFTLLLGLVSALLVNFRPQGFVSSWNLITMESGNQNVILKIPEDIATQGLEFTSVEPTVSAKTDSRQDSVAPQTTVALEPESGASDVSGYIPADSFAVFSVWLVFYWVCGLLLMLAIRGYQYHQFIQMMSHKKPLQDVMLLSGLASLKRAAGFTGEIKLYSSDLLKSPIVLNQKQIVLPEVFVTQYSSAQQQAALAHELAHIKHHDVLWQKVFMFMEVVFFFQPLNQILRKRLYQMVEQRSDDVASKWTGNPRALAEALSVTAQQHLKPSHSKWVLAMKCQKSDLLLRVESLLKGGTQQTPRKVIYGMLLAAVAVSYLAPGVSITEARTSVIAASSYASDDNHSNTPDIQLDKGSHSWSFHHITDDDGVGRMSISSSTDNTHWELTSELTGKIQFNDDETGITYFPPDSELEVKIDDGIDRRRLTISREQDEIEYVYYVNRERIDIRQDQAWFVSFIPELLRTTGWYAQERVQRLLHEGGIDRVLQEVDAMQTHHGGSKARYLMLLPQLQPLSIADVNNIIARTSDIASDHSKSKILTALIRDTRFHDGGNFDKSNWQALLANVNDIESDVEMVKVMEQIALALPVNSDLWPEIFQKMTTIQSDYQLAKLLKDLISQRPMENAQLIDMLKLARTIESDFELSSLLRHMAGNIRLSDDVIPGWLETARTLESDYELKRALSQLISVQVTAQNLVRVIRLAKYEIQSDYELASLFVTLIRNQTMSQQVRDQVNDALSEIQSDNERMKVLRALEV